MVTLLLEMEDAIVLEHLGGTADSENLSQGKEPTVSKIGEIKRNIYGYQYDESENKKEYTVLLVGASKCGKSTVIDFIANFFKKIILPKNGLFYVTRDNDDKLDKTDKEALCFYTFCTKDTVFNFIDSPSVNNESGFVDAKRKEIFQKSIHEIKENNIEIHAVGFVIQNHFVRLGPAEENMLRFVTGLLGGKIANLIPFITYADANTPPVLEALQIFKIDTEKHLVFNNVCLNTTIDKITKLSEIYWEDGLENIQKGIDIIMKLEPIDLIDIPIENLSLENKNEPPTCSDEETKEGPRNKQSGKADSRSKAGGTEKVKKNKDKKYFIRKEISTIATYKRNTYVSVNGENGSKKEYTVLLVGASQCGKSTLIDCIANFFANIKSDNINDKLYVTRNSTDKMDRTNTEDFCFYTFCTKDAVFNFIDSPSITNDLGFVDIKCKQDFEKFLKEIKIINIKVNAVGLVIQNHFVRLPLAEENMMMSITGLLADTIDNIIPFITYADANTPPVLDTLRAFQIDTKKHLVFNNVCLNPSISKITDIEKICWRRGIQNVQKGIDIIKSLEPICLPEKLPVAPRTNCSTKFGGTERATRNKFETTNVNTDPISEPINLKNRSKSMRNKKKNKKANYAADTSETNTSKKSKKKRSKCVIS